MPIDHVVMESRAQRAIREFRSQTDIFQLAKHASNFEEYLIPRPYGPWMIPEDTLFPPTRLERGEFFVVDVGGSTCRLVKVDLSDCSLDIVAIITIDSEAKRNVVEFVATQLVNRGVEGEVALTWSFPLYDGKFETMGKGFANLYQGEDVLSVFNYVLGIRGALCRITCVCTDGAAALLSQRFSRPDGNIALTWGTGININVYMDETLINSELSMVGRVLDDGDTFYELRCETEFDHISEFQPLESIVGGPQLEILAERILGEPIEFWQVLHDPTHEHFELVDAICDRAAALMAAPITAFLRKTGYTVVSYTGSVITDPLMRKKVVNFVQHLAQPIEFVPHVNGSMIGAAVLASMTKTQRELEGF